MQPALLSNLGSPRPNSALNFRAIEPRVRSKSLRRQNDEFRASLQAILCGLTITSVALAPMSAVAAPAKPRAPAPIVRPVVDNAVEQQAFEASARPASQKTVIVRVGETLSDALKRLGAAPEEAASAIASMGKSLGSHAVEPGEKITVLMGGRDAAQLVGFALASGVDKTVSVVRNLDGGFRAREINAKLVRQTARASGTIGDAGLTRAVVNAGAPERAASDFAAALAYDVDFQRDVTAGSKFEMVFERFLDGKGDVVRMGDPVYARLEGAGGRVFEAFRFKAPGSDTAEWFSRDGRALKKFLLRTPINGARLTSGFGWRRHPVLGYSKAHKGVDFGAPTGTPILAAGDGEVVRAGWQNGFGNIVEIRHDGIWTTAYAHMSRFAPGMTPGDRVKQGDVIGFVGSTGRSTGPHLHYEIRQYGQAIDPMGVDAPDGKRLFGPQYTAFASFRAKTDQMRGRRGSAEPLIASAGLQVLE